MNLRYMLQLLITAHPNDWRRELVLGTEEREYGRDLASFNATPIGRLRRMPWTRIERWAIDIEEEIERKRVESNAKRAAEVARNRRIRKG
jgi:hypothetical protein